MESPSALPWNERPVSAEYAVTSKSWTTATGKARTGKLIDKGHIYRIFNSPVYLGMAGYKGQCFPGEHEAIISQELWDRVQGHLKTGTNIGKAQKSAKTSTAPSLLRGMLYSVEGRLFTPGWTSKKQKVYRYYINTDAIKIGKSGCEVQRIPAGEIETVVIEQLRKILQSPEVLAHTVRETCEQRPSASEAGAIQVLQSIDAVWEELFPAEQARIVQTLVDRITIRRDGISITWKTDGMTKLLKDTVMLQEAA